MKLFVSALTYGLGKVLGMHGAAREFAQQLVDPNLDPAQLIPAARTIRRLREAASGHDLIVYHGAGTALPKARSRAAHAALESGAEHWLMVDDDVETDVDTLRRLLSLAHDRCAVLPCAIRGGDNERHRVNVVWDGSLVALYDGVQGRTVRRGGCGLVIVSRPALQRVTDYYREDLSFDDDDGESKVALFQQMFGREGKRRLWLNEDYSFCERLRGAGVTIVAPVAGKSAHDGAVIDLAECALIPGDE